MARYSHGTINPSTTSGTLLAQMLSQRTAAEDSGHSDVAGRPSYATAGMIYAIISGGVTNLWLAGSAVDGSLDVNLSQILADRPGTIKATAEVRLPTGWLWCDGAAVSRTTYAALFAAICPSFTGTVTNGSQTITAVNENFTLLGGAAGLIGAKIEGVGVPAGTTITAVAATTMTMSAAGASATGAPTTLTIFPHGNSSSTNFNVPNCKGRVIIGRQDMGAGGSTGLITSGGAGFDGTRLAAIGGTETNILTAAQIPAHTHVASSSGALVSGTTSAASTPHSHSFSGVSGGENQIHTHAPPGATQYFVHMNSGVGGTLTVGGGSRAILTNETGSEQQAHTHNFSGSTGTENAGHTHSLSSLVVTVTTTVNANTGGGAAHLNVQPSIIENYVIKT